MSNHLTIKKPLSPSCLLNKNQIIQEWKAGNIVIDPFNVKQLNNVSYDITLGEYYYSENDLYSNQYYSSYCLSNSLFNIYDETQVKEVWGTYKKAVSPLSEVWRNYERVDNVKINKNISEDDKIIWISPGETMLCHTNEFIGGRNCITTEMKAKSSIGRCFLSICKCAGWGDIGYVNRWTMEITNHSHGKIIPLVVGRPIGQMIFFKTAIIDPK